MGDRIPPPRCMVCNLFVSGPYPVVGRHEQSYDQGEYIKEVMGECFRHGTVTTKAGEWNDWDMWVWEEAE